VARAVRTPGPGLGELLAHPGLGGGKRIRPALVILSAQCYSYRRETVIPMAAVVELVHAATLIHDDVIDAATTRRGHPTVARSWGDRRAVLLGDYLFARAFALLAGLGRPGLVRAMAGVVHGMCEGELEQLQSEGCFDLGEERYLERIGKKTALFIAECCRAGAVLGGAPPSGIAALGRYGRLVGMAYQIIDDVLDFVAPETLGKPQGSDLRAGIATLPLILALASPESSELRELLENTRDQVAVARAGELVVGCGAVEQSLARATGYTQAAKAALAEVPATAARATLLELADMLCARRW